MFHHHFEENLFLIHIISIIIIIIYLFIYLFLYLHETL